MAEKRYVEVKIQPEYYGTKHWCEEEQEFVETLTFTDILKAEIKDGSLKGLREKIMQAILDEAFNKGTTVFQYKNNDYVYGDLDKTADAIIKLLVAEEPKAKGWKG